MRRRYLLQPRKKSTTINSTDPLEPEPEIRDKLLLGDIYTLEDIKICIESISKTSPFNYTIIRKDERYNQNLNFQPTPMFIIYEQNDDDWQLLCICYHKYKRYFMYKNSMGIEKFPNYFDELIEKHQNVIIKTNIIKNQEIDFPNAPIMLRNLKIIIDNLYDDNNINSFLENFEKHQFCTQKDLDQFKVLYTKDIVHKLKQNQKFLEILKRIIDNIPEISGEISDFYEILEKEFNGKNQDEINFNKIEEVKQQLLTSPKMEIYKNNIDNNNMSNKYEEEISKKFPQESELFQKICKLINNMVIDDNSDNVIKMISEQLNIDYQKLNSFLKSKLKKLKAVKEEKLKCKEISEIDLPPLIPQIDDNDVANNEQLLKEVELYGTNPEMVISQNQRLRNLCEIIERNSIDWDEKKINEWAKNIRGKLGNSDKELCDVITILNRAYFLLSGGNVLRRTQIISILVYMIKDPYKGQLLQIQTGEGKTLTASLLAIIKVLQGFQVDVITSNSVLAQEGVKKTTDFYNIFNITVATNVTNYEEQKERKCASLQFDEDDNDDENERKKSYKADILYGTISSFQFDYLKDIVENLNIRQNRKYEVVILDEVDCMLIDNGGHIAKLSIPFPGMKSFRYLYIKIWVELAKADKKCTYENQLKIIENVKNLIKVFNENDSRQNKPNFRLEELSNIELSNYRDNIKREMKKNLEEINLDMVPKHLREYAQNKIDTWIDSAIKAEYDCQEYQEYRIINDKKTNEAVIVPVDYENTGTTLKNTVWSNGLHQFLQLKHNLCLTYESLTSSFISNIGYIKNYRNENIFGMTGTLGSEAEQKLLSNIYKVNFAVIPPYKPKRFSEFPGKVVDDQLWVKTIHDEIIDIIRKYRAVLVICKTENDLRTIKKYLEQNNENNDVKYNLRTYVHEEDGEEVEKEVMPRDIILSTNLAGRGTDLKTSIELEKSGGLHVCVAFLPYNLRVEQQAFGRTARQGKTGSAQLIICQSEVEDYHQSDFIEIKKQRDQLESERLKNILLNLLPELNFKDEIFSHFAKKHRELKRKANTKDKYIILKDLKEYWAFWLEKNNYTASIIKKTNAITEFKKFETEVSPIIDQNIMNNPFYYIDLAKYYLENRKLDKARDCLVETIQQNGNCTLLYGAHMKLFEVAIESGKQIENRVYKALKKLAFLSNNVDESYKDIAVKHLEDAENAIKEELKFITANFGIESNLPNRDMLKIFQLTDRPNYLIEHINSTYVSLKCFEKNIIDIRRDMDQINGGIIFSDISPDHLQKDKNVDTKIVKKVEVSELAVIGLDAFYKVKEIYDVSITVIRSAQAQFLLGFAALGSAVIFPIALPVLSPLANMLISEAVVDIVMNIIEQGKAAFSKTKYIWGKVISYGIFIVSLGINQLMKCQKLVEKAIECCKKLSGFLRESKYLKFLCEKLANYVDHFQIIFENSLSKIHFAKMTDAEKLSNLKKWEKTNPNLFEQLGGKRQLQILKMFIQSNSWDKSWHIFREVSFQAIKSTGKSICLNAKLVDLVNLAKITCCEEVLDLYSKRLLSLFQNVIKDDFGENVVTISKNVNTIELLTWFYNYFSVDLSLKNFLKSLFEVDDVFNAYLILKNHFENIAIYKKMFKELINFLKSQVSKVRKTSQGHNIKYIIKEILQTLKQFFENSINNNSYRPMLA